MGPRPVEDIKPAEILEVLRKVEAKGHHETARRMRSLASRIFRFGAATSRATSDPTSLLRGALIAPKVKHHSAIVDVKEVGPLLRAIDGFTGQPLTKLALQLTPHVFVRPGELRRAEWKEFDLMCLIPRFDGAILSSEWKEAAWDRYVTGAPRPRTPSEQQYSDRKLRSRR